MFQLGALLHEHPERRDRERGRRRPRGPHALGEAVRGGREHERPAHGHELERDVVVQERCRGTRPSGSGAGSSTCPIGNPAYQSGDQPESRPCPNQCFSRNHGMYTWAPMSPPLVVVFRNRSPNAKSGSRLQLWPGVRIENTMNVQMPTITHPIARSQSARGLIVLVHDASRTRARLEPRTCRRSACRRRSAGIAGAFVDHGAGHVETACQAGRRESSFTRVRAQLARQGASVRGSSELQDLAQRHRAGVVLPAVRFAPRAAVKNNLAPCDPHTDRDQGTFRTSCATVHPWPPCRSPWCYRQRPGIT